MSRRQEGFTLIEMAIVLVIIGLILGVVLNGQNLIASAKKKRLVSNFREFEAAYNTFCDRYGQYPGDENDLKGVNSPEGDTENGNGNGFIDGAEDDNFGQYVWRDLAKASISQRKTDNPFGGIYGWMAVNFHPSESPGINHYHNTVYATNVPAERAREIDLAYDDGIWNTGEIMADGNYVTMARVTLYWRL
ncbi:MAG: prepilin-type N-terminal cleavage/methylation domain-containing protein [Deltaproteobacteria bacterium]|nr:prepilin-type N-terminal cleavage/methylation domain-containing protein [Deltaproteobacteria bacterium]